MRWKHSALSFKIRFNYWETSEMLKLRIIRHKLQNLTSAWVVFAAKPTSTVRALSSSWARCKRIKRTWNKRSKRWRMCARNSRGSLKVPTSAQLMPSTSSHSSKKRTRPCTKKLHKPKLQSCSVMQTVPRMAQHLRGLTQVKCASAWTIAPKLAKISTCWVRSLEIATSIRDKEASHLKDSMES